MIFHSYHWCLQGVFSIKAYFPKLYFLKRCFQKRKIIFQKKKNYVNFSDLVLAPNLFAAKLNWLPHLASFRELVFDSWPLDLSDLYILNQYYWYYFYVTFGCHIECGNYSTIHFEICSNKSMTYPHFSIVQVMLDMFGIVAPIAVGVRKQKCLWLYHWFAIAAAMVVVVVVVVVLVIVKVKKWNIYIAKLSIDIPKLI